MASSQTWDSIHTERRALADDLKSLNNAQWNTQSLCSDWSVRQVLGHMTATASMTPPKFFVGLAGSGFRFEAFLDKLMTAQLGDSPADTLNRFTAKVDATTHPPGPTDAWLGETIMHAEDIRAPLGITHQYSPEALHQLMDFYTRSNLVVGGKKRATGLTLRASDGGWSVGSGPEVTGRGISLLQAITGRAKGLGALSGDGVETLRERVTA